MSKMIQIRNVPEKVHRRLKARAALEGKSLSDYLLEEIRRVAERPTQEELQRRLEALEPRELTPSPTQVVRELRDGF